MPWANFMPDILSVRDCHRSIPPQQDRLGLWGFRGLWQWAHIQHTVSLFNRSREKSDVSLSACLRATYWFLQCCRLNHKKKKWKNLTSGSCITIRLSLRVSHWRCEEMDRRNQLLEKWDVVYSKASSSVCGDGVAAGSSSPWQLHQLCSGFWWLRVCIY